jgi:hypothetical protein
MGNALEVHCGGEYLQGREQHNILLLHCRA